MDDKSVEEKLRLAEIRLERTQHAAWCALMEMSAWLGLPEKRRNQHIESLMENVKFCAKNNVEGDEKHD